MTAGHGRGGLALAALLLAGVAVAPSGLATTIDPTATLVGFTLKTRWGQAYEGRFRQPEGSVATLPDGRHQVHLRLPTREVEILGNPSYTRLTRGPGFFDAERHGHVSFLSDAYPAALMRSGGPLGGELTIRGHQQREVFTVEPSSCTQPAVDCDVVAAGSVRRSDYGMSRWGFALSDRVRFTLRVRVQGPLDP